ncbi:hypothetical protein [Pseudomonas helleri]|uniref:hypothetical protein n=1 Tax=Pseudomonas helleri TaxID=1608996 RepID=UPI003FD25CB9
MSDYAKLKALAEAATPGRVHDRLDSCGGGLKYECFGDDGSLVLKVDHKNDEWGFVGDKGEADEAFFLACTPAAVLELIAENERLGGDLSYAVVLAENRQLKAECEGLRADAERLAKATAFVRQLSDAAGKQPSVATGYLHDILTAMSKESGQ